MWQGLARPAILFGEGVTGQRVRHRPALGVPPLIAGPWGAEWSPRRGAKALCATGPVPCQAVETPILMDVGYLGLSLTWNLPPPVSWSSRISGMLVLASPGWAGMADEGLSWHGGSCPVELPSLSLPAAGVSVLSGMPGHAIPSLAAGDELFCCACATHCQSHPALSWLPSSVPTDTSTALREAPARTHGVGHTPAHTQGMGPWGSFRRWGRQGPDPMCHGTGGDCCRTGWGRHGWHVSQHQQQGASGAQMGQAEGGACHGWVGERPPGPPSVALFHCTSAMAPLPAARTPHAHRVRPVRPALAEGQAPGRGGSCHVP